ncbi:hypothetical protein JCM21900_001032 [Sporobolomyces salmonicolor]
MLLNPRRRLLALLFFVCLLPLVSLVVVYRRLPALSPSPTPPLSLSPSDSSLAQLDPPPAVQNTTPVMSNSVKSTVDQKIQNGHVVVFSKSYCPYCRKAKQLLQSLGEEFDVYELDQMDEGGDWQNYLAEKTGQRTVPNIFIDGKHVGGSSDLDAKHRSGELKALLGAKA